MITWNELSEAISRLSPEERECMVLSQCPNTGEMFGYIGITTNPILLNASDDHVDDDEEDTDLESSYIVENGILVPIDE